MLFNIHTRQWDDDLLKLLRRAGEHAARGAVVERGLRRRRRRRSASRTCPIAGIAGDQQAALFGQMCVTPGLAKNTYGTGCFMLQNTGDDAGRLAQPAARRPSPGRSAARRTYALEGSVFIGGAVVQWLRDGLGIIAKSSDVEALAASVAGQRRRLPRAGVRRAWARRTGIRTRAARSSGITRGTTAGHIARAALESIAFQVADLLRGDAATTPAIDLAELRVDGGAAANNVLMQFQADLLGVPVVRPKVTETTALGAAYLAGLAVGFWDSADVARATLAGGPPVRAVSGPRGRRRAPRRMARGARADRRAGSRKGD